MRGADGIISIKNALMRTLRINKKRSSEKLMSSLTFALVSLLRSSQRMSSKVIERERSATMGLRRLKHATRGAQKCHTQRSLDRVRVAVCSSAMANKCPMSGERLGMKPSMTIALYSVNISNSTLSHLSVLPFTLQHLGEPMKEAIVC